MGGPEAKKASRSPELTGLAVSRKGVGGAWGKFTEVREPPGAWSKAPGEDGESEVCWEEGTGGESPHQAEEWWNTVQD